MNSEKETMLLRDPQILPVDEVLNGALGESYPAFGELVNTISNVEYGLMPEWNYYNDGKAWLCKVLFKKKTVFWLSVWDGYFKATFYFTEKNCGGLDDLDLDRELMQSFVKSKPIGRLMPFTFVIRESIQLTDLLKVIQYKKSLK